MANSELTQNPARYIGCHFAATERAIETPIGVVSCDPHRRFNFEIINYQTLQ
jgi:hypothetical protein